jgi:hypothetical protein
VALGVVEREVEMEFHIHIDNIKEVVEQGSRVKIVLKNEVVLEDRIENFQFDDPYVYHFTGGRER